MDNSETKVERRQLTAREKVFLTVTLLAVIGAGFYTFEYKALTARMAGAQNQLVILADNIKTYQEAFRLIHSQKIGEKIEQRDQEIAALQSDINTIKARMAEKVVDIVRELRRQAEHQGAKMLSLNTRERAVASQDISYKEVTLFLTFESNYQAIKNFVMELYQIPAILAVRDMQMKRTRENYPAIVTSMTIKLYVK